MSDKFFFKGRKTPKPKHESYGYNTKRAAKLGTELNPLHLIVNSPARETEINQQLLEHDIVAKVVIDGDVEENIAMLEPFLNKIQRLLWLFKKVPPTKL